MMEDEEGFCPFCDTNICTECGLCEKVYPIKDRGYHRAGEAFSAIVETFCNKNYAILVINSKKI